MGLGTGAGFVAGIDLVRSGKGGPFWQGAYGGATMAAGGLALMVVPQLVGSLGWRAPYWTGLVLALARRAPRPRGEAHAACHSTPKLPEARRQGVIGDRRLWPLAAVQIATFGLSVVAGNWIVTLLEHEGHGRSISGVVGGLVLFAGVVTRPAGGLVVLPRPRQRLDARRRQPRRGLCRRARARRRAAALGLRARRARRRPRRRIPVRRRLRHDAAAPPRRSRGSGRASSTAAAVLVILVCTPLAGLTFSLPGDGRLAFLAIGLAWATALLAVGKASARCEIIALLGERLAQGENMALSFGVTVLPDPPYQRLVELMVLAREPRVRDTAGPTTRTSSGRTRSRS